MKGFVCPCKVFFVSFENVFYQCHYRRWSVQCTYSLLLRVLAGVILANLWECSLHQVSTSPPNAPPSRHIFHYSPHPVFYSQPNPLCSCPYLSPPTPSLVYSGDLLYFPFTGEPLCLSLLLSTLSEAVIILYS